MEEFTEGFYLKEKEASSKWEHFQYKRDQDSDQFSSRQSHCITLVMAQAETATLCNFFDETKFQRGWIDKEWR